MESDAVTNGVIDNEMEKQNILDEIKRVRQEINDKQKAPTLLRRDKLKLQLVRLYKRYTDLGNFH